MTEEKKRLKLKPSSDGSAGQPLRKGWRVLVVDDDDDVHAVTRMVLSKMQFKGRGIELLTAYSGVEARKILERERDIAVILLDVVMESDDAGLRLIKVIRDEIGNQSVRIVLRTGQPGQAPEESVIIDYDINDYKAKSELTSQKLFTTVIAALRSFETIISLEKTRDGLEKILESTSTLFQVHSMSQFSSGVLTQLSAFLGCQPNGIMCVQFENDPGHIGRAYVGDLQILAASGIYAECVENSLDEEECRNKHEIALELARKALSEHQNQLTDDFTVLYIETGAAHAAVMLLHGGLSRADEGDQRLLKVFASKISIAFANALNYQKMISAEMAATTDFLTELNNRRQLLRLGVPLVAGAFRAGTPITVAMLDIDHFKLINDTFGHDAGDGVLRRVGALMQDRFRTSDVVARFGGEEFCVIAANLDRDAAYDLFDSFRRSFNEQVFEIQNQRVPITISIGITTVMEESLDAMIMAADEQLYRAKQQGRNCVVVG